MTTATPAPKAFAVEDVRAVLRAAETPLSTTEISEACAAAIGHGYTLASELLPSVRKALASLDDVGEVLSARSNERGENAVVLPSWYHGGHRYYLLADKLQAWRDKLAAHRAAYNAAVRNVETLRGLLPTVEGSRPAHLDHGQDPKDGGIGITVSMSAETLAAFLRNHGYPVAVAE